MKYLPTPEFTRKVAVLGPADRQRLTVFLKHIAYMPSSKSILESSHGYLAQKITGQDVVVIRVGRLRIFTSMGQENGEEYILLLDIANASNEMHPPRDPRTNAKLNPNNNRSINPTWNRSLDPSWNRSLDPSWNRPFTGIFMYDSSMTPAFYLVDANEKICLMFNMDNEWQGTAIRNGKDGFLVFDRDRKWVEYMISDGQHGYLRFDRMNKWIGIAV